MYAKTSDLPEAIQRALSEVSYHRKDIEVEAAEEIPNFRGKRCEARIPSVREPHHKVLPPGCPAGYIKTRL